MASCFSQPGLLPFEQAFSLIQQNIPVVKTSETVSIEKACGRILCEAVISPVNVPPHDNSAMDGYAFASSSAAEGRPLTLVGKVFAGSPYTETVNRGECVRIMTGGKIPTGCDSVEMQENAMVDGNLVTLQQAVREGQHVRRCGEDIKSEQAIYQPGHKFTAADIGALASLGISEVTVQRALKVALIATGDELKSPGQELTDGDIYESNRYFLKALLEQFGADVLDFGIIPDVPEQIEQAFQDANEQADVLITSGGVSVGEADFTKDVLEKLGDIGFWKIAMKPGKPFAFGRLSKAMFFGLPGNPVSALVTFYQLVLPNLYAMLGTSMPPRVKLNAIAGDILRKSPGRTDFQRGVYGIDESGQLVVKSTGAQGSGILTSIAKANCFVILEKERGRVEVGEQVTIELFDQYLS
ncbi:gephyrin-like molybdotransferase Glp [Thalassotalea euphylliae]|uniref:molybdopterin molybdotransferase MoeA n=1 Tax=Thalassotalea euphylliae TaxID=1655234 RepID=UPI00363EDD73